MTNRGVARYRELEGRHLEPVFPRSFGPDVIALMVRTRQSRIHVAQAARTRVFSGDQALDAQRSLHQMEDYVQTVISFDVTQGAPVRVEKMVALYTSHDRAISEPLGNAGKSVGDYPSFGEALADHRSAWDELWEACDLVRPGTRRAAAAAASHRARPAGLLAPLGRSWTPASPRGGRTARRTGATCSGTSCTCSRSSTSGLPRIGRHLPSTGRAGWGGAPSGAGGRLSRRDVPVAERQRRPEETQVVHLNLLRAPGARPQPTTSAT